MTLSLVVLCFAAVALIAWAVSAVVGLGLRVFNARVLRLEPSAQARVYLLASVLPAFFATIVLVAALAPSFGWIADHCVSLGDPHSDHPHMCVDHHVAALPSATVTALAGLFALRLAISLLVRVRAVIGACIALRALSKAAASDNAYGVCVLPNRAESQAFVLGLLRPKLFVTEPLVAGSDRRYLHAVLAHERAHIRRRDPLGRFVAGIGFAFHLPFVVRMLERSLCQAQEMAADREAASDVGRASVARALLALARSRRHVPRPSLAFAGQSIEMRIRSLLDDRVRCEWPRARTVGVVVVASIVLVGAGAGGVHHGVEMLLGAFGG